MRLSLIIFAANHNSNWRRLSSGEFRYYCNYAMAGTSAVLASIVSFVGTADGNLGCAFLTLPSLQNIILSLRQCANISWLKPASSSTRFH